MSAHPEVFKWLAKVRSETMLKGGRRRYDLLDYLVREELEGRGESLKAYAIALDVLGRSEDFDPATDSIVRVEVARLRDALELYYARSTEPNEPKISIPKGSYRPIISSSYQNSVGQEVPPRRKARRRTMFLAGLALGALGAAVLAFFAFVAPERAPPQSDRPVLEIAALATDLSVNGSNFALGFRQKLVSDLAHLPTVVVRDGPLASDAVRSRDVASPDYRLSITPAIEGQSGIIGLQLVSVGTGAVVWSRTIPVSDGTSDFYATLQTAVRGIGQEVAGPSGAITIEQASLALDAIADGGASVDEYQCLILSLVFDATKEERVAALSRNCLSDAVAQNTQNATLLASFALNQFFESSGLSKPDGELTLLVARSHAVRAVQINPSDAFAHEVLGNILSALGDRTGAIEHYERAVELAPSRPAPHFLLGWQMALQGDWENGVIAMQDGIDMQPDIPGYMIIPLALDAFRRSDFEGSLRYAETVIRRGDMRGYALAFAASLALGDTDAAETFFSHPDARTSSDPSDPMREVRVTFSNPDVMPRYEDVIEPYMTQLESQ
ncbi:MAG: tetratricopeptide repeat protein [Pseudomonadota bacterium]